MRKCRKCDAIFRTNARYSRVCDECTDMGRKRAIAIRNQKYRFAVQQQSTQ